MTVLALEPDPAQAATIRHVVCQLVRAELELVESIDGALGALHAGTPDLILLPALYSPADEAELLAHLRTLPDAAHVETLVTPHFCTPDDRTPVGQSGRRRWWARKGSTLRPGGYDPRAFAGQLTESLQRAREVRQQHAERRRLLSQTSDAGTSDLVLVTQAVDNPQPDRAEPPLVHVHHECRLPEPIVFSEPVPTLGYRLPADRRVHRRFPPHELQWIQTARLKYGPLVSLVDLSAGGALLETEFRLRPESEAVLELVGAARDFVVPFRIVRCQVSALKGRLLYRGACAFTRPLELVDLVLPRSAAVTDSTIDHLAKFDIALKTIVERYVMVANDETVTGAGGTLRSVRASQVTELARSLHEASCLRPFDPVVRSLRDLLAAVVSALQRCDRSAVTSTLIEEQLRRALPWLTVQFAEVPASIHMADAEAIYFRVPGQGANAPSVLSVELPQGSALEDWQFRLLKASTYLAALLQTIPEVEGTVSSDAGRRHVR